MMNKNGAGLRNYTISFLIVVFFAFCMFWFSMNFLRVTNPSSDVLSTNYVNNSIISLNNTMADFRGMADDMATNLGQANPSPLEFVFLIFRDAFFIPISILKFFLLGTVSLMTILLGGLGGSGTGVIGAVIIGLMTTGFYITIVLLIVKAIRSGESER